MSQIEAALRDPSAKAANFTDVTGGGAAQACGEFFTDASDLVDASGRLAKQLHASMASNRSISGGDLVVCSYRTADYPTTPQCLALLKIDSMETFQPKASTDAQGDVHVDLGPVANVLPGSKQRLQKCAFIQPLQPQHLYHMMLLDRQTRPESQFFIHGFLGAYYALDAPQRTSLLYQGWISAQNQLRESRLILPSDEEVMRAAIEHAIASTSVNLDTLIYSLPLSSAGLELLDGVISLHLPDREFDIDPTFVTRLLRRRIFRGDHGLRFSIESNHFEDVVWSRWVEDGTGPAHYEIVLRTGTWQEVVK